MKSNLITELTLPDVTLNSLLVNLSLGIVLSFIIAWHYSRRSSEKTLRRDLGLVLPIIALTTLVVITVVKSSLALSLGLVGALSIVRFRTPIKEPEELAYIFLSIAMGLALGADQREAAVIGVIVVLAVICAIDFFYKNRNEIKGNLLLSLEINSDKNQELQIDQILDILSKNNTEINLRRVDQDRNRLCLVCLAPELDKTKISNLSTTFLKEFPDGKLTIIDDHSFPND
jgi:uncharacterized membrane protein YhiD involved in acid resistance